MVTRLDIIPCPLCSEKLSAFSRGRTFHARAHGITLEELYRRAFPAIAECKCGCGKAVRWLSWDLGYEEFVRGHCSKESKACGVKQRLEKLSSGEFTHWTNKIGNAPILREASEKRAATLKDGYKKGRIEHWSRGEKSSVDAIRQKISIAHTGRSPKNHPLRTPTNELQEEILKSLGNRFDIISGGSLEELDDRAKNTEHVLTLQCSRCALSEKRSVYNTVRHPTLGCPRCDQEFSSQGEREVFAWIESLGVPAFQNDRGTLPAWELDISVPDQKLAIDFNGLYWHSELVQKNRAYHDTKSRVARKNDVRLFHIFEDEWRDKRSIVQSMIMHRLRKSASSVPARKCTIKQLVTSEARNFFDSSHIDGFVPAKVTFGLFFDGQIVAALSLRTPHEKMWNGRLEVARFATRKFTSVPGGLARLTKQAILWADAHEFRGLMTYADTRFGSGDGYERAGWSLAGETGIMFWWTDRKNRFNRRAITATTTMTETENAKSKGMVKIWGCKNRRFLLDF